jgi:pimeloyl-ACP methyl ester carboxylesterase
MKTMLINIRNVLFGSTLLLSLLPLQATAEATPDLRGAWVGSVKVGASQLRLRFNLTQDAKQHSDNQNYSATMDSIDQGASGIPISRVTLTGQQLKLDVTVAQASYQGLYQAQPEQIQGQWLQGGQSFELILTRQLQEARKPQDPVKPYPYIEEQISFNNEAAGIALAGTLTRPANAVQAVPAVVLISGSGPQDRDQQMLGHRPFLVLADYLTRQGFAVLRFDDRGIGKSGGTFLQATSLDFASDVSAAVRYLQHRPDINKKQIGLIGHSEGGLIAPIVSLQQAGVGFLVLLAAPGIPGAEVSTRQFASMLKARGVPESTVSHATTIYQSMNKLAAQQQQPDVAELETHYQQLWQALPSEVKQQLIPLGGGRLSPERLAELQNNWYRYFQRHDPQPWLSKIQVPTLVLYGDKDTQLEPATNLAAIEKSLQQAKNARYQVILLEGLNHMFQPATTGRWDEYAGISETLSPKFLTSLSQWLQQVTEPLAK